MSEATESKDKIEARHRMNSNVDRCQAARDGAENLLEHMWIYLFQACLEMKNNSVSDFKMHDEKEDLGLKTEIEKVVHSIDRYYNCFHDLLREYESIKTEDDE